MVKFLKLFTFLDRDEIDNLQQSVEEEPHLRKAQRKLGEEITRLIHGQEGLDEALKVTDALFSGDFKALESSQIKDALKDAPSQEVDKETTKLVDLLVEANISSSKRQAREDIQNGAIYVNGERQQDLDYEITDADKFDQEFTVFRRGKKKYTIVTYK